MAIHFFETRQYGVAVLSPLQLDLWALFLSFIPVLAVLAKRGPYNAGALAHFP
jgi:hypothetical protein